MSTPGTRSAAAARTCCHRDRTRCGSARAGLPLIFGHVRDKVLPDNGSSSSTRHRRHADRSGISPASQPASQADRTGWGRGHMQGVHRKRERQTKPPVRWGASSLRPAPDHSRSAQTRAPASVGACRVGSPIRDYQSRKHRETDHPAAAHWRRTLDIPHGRRPLSRVHPSQARRVCVRPRCGPCATSSHHRLTPRRQPKRNPRRHRSPHRVPVDAVARPTFHLEPGPDLLDHAVRRRQSRP